MITRVLLVIALLGCLAHAQYGLWGTCVCHRTREVFGNPKAIQDIQIYPPSHNCDKMEIIVFQKNGMKYCLDPKVKKVQELIKHLLSKESASVAVPTKHSGTPGPSEDIQVYPPSRTCDKMQIIVTNKNGKQYCVDPRVEMLQERIRHLQSKESASVAVPTKHSGTPGPSEDIQVYPPSRTCDKMEIIVTNKNGKQHCLDPRVEMLQERIRHLQSN